MIKYQLETDTTTYFDKNGKEIHAYDSIIIDGKVRTVYPTENGLLGLDATNPIWIKSGRAVPCEYGIYPLTEDETNSCEVTEAQDEYLQDDVLIGAASGLEKNFLIDENTVRQLRQYLESRAMSFNDMTALDLLGAIAALPVEK